MKILRKLGIRDFYDRRKFTMAISKTFENEAQKDRSTATELKLENVTAPLADSPVPFPGERAVSSFVLLCLS